MTLGAELPPALLLLPVVLVVLLVIHRRARRPRAFEVPSLLLWEPAAEERIGRAPRLLPWRFWAELAALGLLVGGLAGPVLEGEPRHGRHVVLLLDVSASMQAREGGSTRFALAREEARRTLAALGPADRVAIVSFASRPRVEQAWTDDRRRLAAVLDALEPLDTPTDLMAALTVARALLREVGDTGEAIVISDLPVAEVSWRDPLPLRALRIGTARDNVAITEVSVAQGPFTPLAQARAYVSVRNFSPAAQEVVLAARLAGEEVDRRRAALGGGETKVFVLGGFPRGGDLELELACADDLAVDNGASAWIRPDEAIRTLLVSSDARFVRTVGRLLGGSHGFRAAHVAPGAGGAELAREHDLAIFHRAAPAEWSKAALLIAPPEGADLVTVGGDLRGIRTVDWNPADPVADRLEFPLTRAPLQARRVAPRFPATPVLQAATDGGDVPLVWAGEQRGRRLVVLGFDLGAVDLEAEDNLSLLVLLLNALRWLDPIAERSPRTVPTGFTLSPAAEATAHPVASPPRSPFPFSRAGEYRFATAGGERRYLAQLSDAEESRIWKEEPVEAVGAAHAARPAAVPAALEPERRRLAPLLYGGALLLLAIEWAGYHARRRREDRA